MRHRFLFSLVALCFVSSCAAFAVDRGGLLSPDLSLQRPGIQDLPPSERYVDLANAWRRQTTLGTAGYAEATLWDPLLAAADVAHEGALENLDSASLTTRLADRWDAWYGSARDRFPIDVHWRFDAQFYSNRAMLDPASWTFSLRTDDGQSYAALDASRLDQLNTPQNGYYEGTVRVMFPWRAHNGDQPILGGQTTGVTLVLESALGTGRFHWRFHNEIFRGAD